MGASLLFLIKNKQTKEIKTIQKLSVNHQKYIHKPSVNHQKRSTAPVNTPKIQSQPASQHTKNIQKPPVFTIQEDYFLSYLVNFPRKKKKINFLVLVIFSGKTNQKKSKKFNHWGSKLSITAPAGISKSSLTAEVSFTTSGATR